MACEYREADRSKLEATSSYAGATADEIYIIDRAGEYSGPCFEHLIEIYMAIGRKEPKPITYCPFCGRNRHGAVDTYDIDPRTLLTSDRARRSAANRLLEVYGYSNEIGEADLHDFLAAVLFGPGIKISGNRPIIGRLFELINRPVCVVRTLETDEGEIVPVCSNCGEPISLTDSFCPHCSAEVVGNEFDC